MPITHTCEVIECELNFRSPPQEYQEFYYKTLTRKCFAQNFSKYIVYQYVCITMYLYHVSCIIYQWLSHFRMKEITQSMINVWKRSIATNCRKFVGAARDAMLELHQQANSKFTGSGKETCYYVCITRSFLDNFSERETDDNTERFRQETFVSCTKHDWRPERMRLLLVNCCSIILMVSGRA